MDEDVEREMYETVMDRLEAAGLLMYEISNYARPGHESRHNLVYWANDAYFGFGLGAARYVEGVRSVNTRDLSAYLRRIEDGEPATGPIETARTRTARPRDRHADAPPDQCWASTATTSCSAPASTSIALSAPEIARFVGEGLLEDDGRRVRFTREGRFLADRVLCELV